MFKVGLMCVNFLLFFFSFLKIDEKLKGYKISGSVCSGASRNVHQQCYQKSTTHTGGTIYSPFQRLTEYGKAQRTFSYGPRREKTCLWGFMNNTGADQTAHLRSLICAFVICF